MLDGLGVTKYTGKPYTIAGQIRHPAPNVSDNLESEDGCLDVGVIEREEFDNMGDGSAAVGSGVGDGDVGVALRRLEGGEVIRLCCNRASIRFSSWTSVGVRGSSIAASSWRVVGDKSIPLVSLELRAVVPGEDEGCILPCGLLGLDGL